MFKLLKKIFPPTESSEAMKAKASRQIDLTKRVEDAKIRGNALLAERRFDDAAECYLQVLAIDSGDIEGHINLGFVYSEAKRYSDAEYHLNQALRIDPANIDSLFMLGNLTRDQGQSDLALKYFNTLLKLEPDYEVAYRVLLSLQRYEEAIAQCDATFRSKPDNVEAIVNRGIALHAMERHDDALIDFDRALLMMPNNPEAHFHAGATLKAMENLESAAQRYRQAIELNADYLEAYNNLGTVLLEQNRYEEALANFNQTLRIRPDSADAYLNQGTALLKLRRHAEALTSWEKAVLIKSDLAEAHFNASQCKLQMGDFESGWKEFEWRWRRTKPSGLKPQFNKPLWLGNESLAGKVILLHPEQGLGDTIQFCRLAKQVAERGATVLFIVPKPLKVLLSGLAGVSQLLEPDQHLPAFDFHCPLLSLPLALGITVDTIPSDVPYLHAKPELVNRVYDALDESANVKIGVCWKGGAGYIHDADRSPGIKPFAKFMAGFVGRKVSFYTLLPNSRQMFSSIGGKDIGHELDSDTAPFAETAALISNLDLVVTCDTSIGHLAGALGKPVWLVLPFSPDWRWIINRDDSPWYPQTRLFRQAIAGDWNELFERVAVRLADVLAGTSELVWSIGDKEPDGGSVIQWTGSRTLS